MSDTLLEQNTTVYHEMMSHVPLFMHRNPQKIAIVNDLKCGIEQEILKHRNVNEVWRVTPHTLREKHTDARVKHYSSLTELAKESLDVLIVANQPVADNFKLYFQLLCPEGILLQQSEPFKLAALKAMQQQMLAAGFYDVLPLHFPQSPETSGWHGAMTAIKQGNIRRPREKDIFNRPFTTSYYNLDVHKAAFALPEFMRKELGE